MSESPVMTVKTNKPEVMRKLREGGYLFQVYAAKTDVYLGRRLIGTIVGMKEQSGRHCFRLACDSRREPRTYRGRVQAAQALEMIDDLKRQAKQQRWSIDEIIVRSWDEKPRASQAADAE